MNDDGVIKGAELRRERQREELRRDILDAARDLVNRRGAAGLTMRAVAESVGYSPGALYEYFSSKDDLLETLYFHGAEGLSGRTQQMLADVPPDAPLINRMGVAARAYRAYALEHPDLYRLIFSVTNTRDSQLPEFEDSSFGALVGLLREGAARGDVSVENPVHTAAALWAFVHGFVMLEITGRLPNQPAGISDTLFDEGLKVLAFGLLARDDAASDGIQEEGSST